MQQVEDSDILKKFEDEQTHSEAFSLLLKKYQQKVFEDLAYFEPFYLKDFELKTKKSS